eukprot:9498343-Pyramimonas_sp.AAC.1
MSASGCAIEVGDVVLLEEVAGRVGVCAVHDGNRLVLGEMFVRVLRLSAQRTLSDGRLEAPSRRGARAQCSRRLRGACAAMTSQCCDWFSAMC